MAEGDSESVAYGWPCGRFWLPEEDEDDQPEMPSPLGSSRYLEGSPEEAFPTTLRVTSRADKRIKRREAQRKGM